MMQYLQRNKVAKALHEDRFKSAGEKDSRISKY